MTQIVIGTAGHIDHGKTALVKALTGTDTDSLAQEKARGMTIDLGFAFLNENVTIIDVPGHEKFIRNMVAGVSTIHVALLVIAADDGIMPQTREHLQIISLLGIQKAVIALTKIDLMQDNDWLDLVEEDIRDTLQKTSFKDSPIIRTSINPESGIDSLKRTLVETASTVQLIGDRGFFRMQVDRVFVKTGFGLVTTGTVISGEIHVGEEVVSLPVGKKSKVRGIQSHGANVSSVQLGDRAAVNVSGLEKGQAWRGSELVAQGYLTPTRKLIAHVTMIPSTEWKLKPKQRVRIHLGTSEVLGRVTLVDTVLRENENGNCIIALEEPIVAAMDDRFVVRSYSPMETIAGGVVLDPHPQGKWREIKSWAKRLHQTSVDRYMQFIDRQWANPISLYGWSNIFHIKSCDLKEIVSSEIIEQGTYCVTKKNIEASKNMVVDHLRKYHKENPYRSFIGKKVLQDNLQFSSGWFKEVITLLKVKGIIKNIESGFALTDYKISMSDSDRKKAEMVLSKLNISENLAVSISELTGIGGTAVLKLLHVLKAEGKAMEIQSELWMSTKNFITVTNLLKDWYKDHDKLTVPNFKDVTNLTRKTAIPLLEYLDKHQWTIRTGNERLKGDKL